MTENCISTYNPEFKKWFIENQNGLPDDLYRLLWALYFNFPDVVEEELENGVNVNEIISSGNTALHIACKDRQNSQIIRIVLNYKPLVNIRNEELETPLNLLIKNLYFEIDVLRKLLEMGADPNIPNKDGNTCFHYLNMYALINTDQFENIAALLYNIIQI
ncbi:hypothetical protein WA026_000109 [Henosepilachna vigintioctopunctata]|uniref:Ankyrin repeat protein n=1 Tax=Henosepilachna vigintioctopunctata TaxID=420089 RepID=A0AAW1V6V3_9CUCU